MKILKFSFIVILFFMNNIFSNEVENKPTILVVGGAGYIGSHTSYFLVQQGYKVIILDNLCINKNFTCDWAKIIKADFADKNVLKEIFTNNKIDAVMHFAAFAYVGESVENPLKYYLNNVVKTIQLIETMLEYNVNKFIFSSSCTVYGIPNFLPITEDHPKNPISPYGKTKSMVENFLEDMSKASNLKFVCLRYFNAAGAKPEFGLGEHHEPETHVIPLLLRSALTGNTFSILGTDYPTKDGSCIRDYLHIWDIADAHVKALEYLNNSDNPSDFFNLGTGTGFTVKELVTEVEKITNQTVNVQIAPRRPGDPAMLVADATKAYNVLNWKPICSDLESILRSAYLSETEK